MIRQPSIEEVLRQKERDDGSQKPIKLFGNKYYIRTLCPEDVGERYICWLNDPEINKYLELRFKKWSLDEVKQFVRSYNNKKTFLLGIFTKNSDLHVGNISLRIEHYYDIADFGYFIGEKEYWGKEAASEAIRLLMRFAFVDLRLRKIYGGASHKNIPSIFNFKAMHFKQEGRLRKVEIIDGDWSDTIIFGLLKEEWTEFFGDGQV